MFDKVYSEIIPKSQLESCGIPEVMGLTGGDLYSFLNEKYFYTLLNYKGKSIATLYGRFVFLKDEKSVNELDEVLLDFGPDKVIKHDAAKKLERLGLCKIVVDSSVKTTCGHKAELPVSIKSTGELLCPKCFNKKSPNVMIGRDCILVYVLPF